MKKSQIIKKDVKPILTPVEKIRYSQASSFFIKGMNSYLQNYVMGIKQMVDTKQVTAHYSKQYKSRASQLVERFNNAKDEISKHKRKVVPFLLIFSAGGYLLYRTMKYIGEKFQKEMKDFNNFVSQAYHLFKTPVSKVLSFTKEWSIRIFGGDGFDIQKALYDLICFIPDLIGEMFNFIANGFDFLFNKSELFTSILIQTAKHAWNASFSSAWGWVLSFVFNKAKLKQRRIMSDSGYAKLGPVVHRRILSLREQLDTTINQSISKAAVIEHSSFLGFDTSRRFSPDKSKSETEYINEMYSDILNTYLQKQLKVSDSIYHSLILDTTNYNATMSAIFATHVMPLSAEVTWTVSSSSSPNRYGAGGAGLPGGASAGGNAGGTFSTVGTLTFEKLTSEVNPQVLQDVIEFETKYSFLRNENSTVKSLIENRERCSNSYFTPAIANALVLTKLQWLVFQYQYNKTQLVIQGIRFHSRLQQSEVDNLRDNYLSLNQNFSRNTFNQIDMMFKKYNDEEYSFSDYVRAACEWMFGQVSHDFFRPVGMTLNILEYSHGFSESDTARWRMAWGIPAIERKLIQIRDLLKALHYQQQYGNSYLNGDIYFFSDQVSDASLIGDMQSQLYQGVFGARSQANPQGIEVGTYNVSGVGRNATDTLGNKSSLAYAVRQLIELYVEYRKNVRKLRQQRTQLLSEIKRKLHFLAVCRYVYNKKNADNVWQPRLIIDPQNGQMREVPPTTDTFVARNK